MNAHSYSSDFYKYFDAGSRVYAQAVVRGHGAWAREWLAAGTRDVLSIDGDCVRLGQFAIPAALFQSRDLANHSTCNDASTSSDRSKLTDISF